MGSDMQRAAAAFQSVDWIIPAYFSVGHIGMIGDAIEKADVAKKQEILRTVLPRMYTSRHLASMLLERYAKHTHVREFGKPIAEAIEAAFGGLWHAAITTLMPVLEGILAKMRAARLGESAKDNRNWLGSELTALVEKEKNSLHCYDERIVMLTALRDFCNKRLYNDTKNYKGLDEFNRHGILHGLFHDYGDPINFYRLISILELLCFVIALIHGESCFAPASTSTSEVLAAYYETVLASAASRPDMAKGW